jgi:hypothetical protein
MPGNDQDALTDEERTLFERLAERHDDDEVGRIFELVLQSSEPKEDTNS